MTIDQRLPHPADVGARQRLCVAALFSQRPNVAAPLGAERCDELVEHLKLKRHTGVSLQGGLDDLKAILVLVRALATLVVLVAGTRAS
jgi:hypothetical protein